MVNDEPLEEPHDNESKLSDHQEFKKVLKPPLLQLGNMVPSSWIDERLPEMLWATLLVGTLAREEVLARFRYIADFVHDAPECHDVTMSGISKVTKDLRQQFILRVTADSPSAKAALRPLLLFPTLPAIEDWKQYLEAPDPKTDWISLAQAVEKCFRHQSEPATDCRWIKFLCRIIAGKIQFVKSIEGIQDTLRGVYDYPNSGDPHHVSSFIRMCEMAPDRPGEPEPRLWATEFWRHCFENTTCLPEDQISQRIKLRQEDLSKNYEVVRGHFLQETVEIRNQLLSHFSATARSMAVDARHQASFGLAIYGLTIFIEINFYWAPMSIMARLSLRTLVETYITFKYLLIKEGDEPRVWDGFRSYGSGQLKLTYLKLRELNAEIAGTNSDELRTLANEDRWVEFVPIRLGHWDAANLRKMSESAGLRTLYDRYYAYTSGFMHSNWGAIRESVYQQCRNPLHRYHQIPTYDLPIMQSVIFDAQEMVNGILNCLDDAYPSFDTRLTEPHHEKKGPDQDNGVLK